MGENDTYGFALAAHPGKSQGPPPKSTGSKPIVQNGVPDCVLHNKNHPVPGARYYAIGPEIPAGEIFMPRDAALL